MKEVYIPESLYPVLQLIRVVKPDGSALIANIYIKNYSI
jgi:hypothetical protein